MTLSRNMLIGAVIGFLMFMAFVLSGVASAAENTCRALNIPQLGIHLDCADKPDREHRDYERAKPTPDPDDDNPDDTDNCPHGESSVKGES